MDPESDAVGDLDPSLEIDSRFFSDSIGTFSLPPEPPYVTSGQDGYTHGQEGSISYQHSFQHHSSALQQQQPPLSLPPQLSQDVDFEDFDSMQQPSDHEELTFAITATGEFQCTASKCKTQPVFKRKCDLTCVILPVPIHLPGLLFHLLH